MYQLSVDNIPVIDVTKIQEILDGVNLGIKSKLRFTTSQDVLNAADWAESHLEVVYKIPSELRDGTRAVVTKSRPAGSYRKGVHAHTISFIRKNGEWFVTKLSRFFEHGLSDATPCQVILTSPAAQYYNERYALKIKAA